MPEIDVGLGPGALPPDAPDAGEVYERPAAASAHLHNKRVVSGIAIILLMAVFSFIGPLVYHPAGTTANLANVDLRPGGGHPLGTDIYGVDVLWRLMIGGRASLELSLAVAIASTAIGAVYGAVAGMAGGAVDGLMMRLVDVFLAVPTLLLFFIVASLYSLDLATIIAALSVLSWPPTARIVRGQVLVLRGQEFVQSSASQGASRLWIVRRHVLPNTFNVIAVAASFLVADAIYALSVLSFVGLGPQPPFSDWGTMLTQGVDNLFDGYWWQVYPPLVLLIVTVLAFRQIGDAVNDVARSQTSAT